MTIKRHLTHMIFKADVQANVNKTNCNEETVTNFDDKYTVLQVNTINNKITSKDTPEHQNKDNDQEKITSNQKNKNAPPNKKETFKKITEKNKNSSPDFKRIYIIGDSILKHLQGYEISKSIENCKTYAKHM